MTDIQVTDHAVIIDGVDISTKVKRIEMLLSEDGKNEVAIILSGPVVDVHLKDQEVALVEPESDASVFRRASSYIRTLNTDELQQAALEGLGMGNNNMTQSLVDKICEVFEHAANELDGSEEVRGSSNGGHDQGNATAEDG